ncbi:MAG: glycerophosphodiester phosphodiesterase, partial [Solirubrobacterales bacterium]
MALAVACMSCAALILPAVTNGSPLIHAHRGGAIVKGQPTYPENSMPAFRRAARQGFVLELDAKLTADGVPVVFHDATLDRVTPCTGLLADRTLAQLRDCKLDVLGTADHLRQLAVGDHRRAPIPSFSAVLRLLRRTGASANIEIKNIPTDPDFDATSQFATTVADAIARSGIPSGQLIVQSFLPPNLTVAQQRLPGVETSLLSIGAANEAFIDLAHDNGNEWVSPQWPVSQDYVSEAHSVGLRVVPYTVDIAADMRAAFEIGVDALITNDPTRARRVFARAEGPPPRIPPPPSAAQCKPTFAKRSKPPIRAFDPARGAPRVFAMQFKQELRNVETYGSFRRKIECMILRYVIPFKARGRPNVVAFNEDVGLMTLATGSRGAEAREIAGGSDPPPACAGSPPPCAALQAALSVGNAYPGPRSAYLSRFAGVPALGAPLLFVTDTFARGWMQVFSDMARRYGVYMLGSNDQAPFRESRDPAEIETFRDPDLPRPDSVFVATAPQIYNEAFLWAPRFVRREGPSPLRNVVAQNRKVPLTTIEQGLQLTPGPSGGADGI